MSRHFDAIVIGAGQAGPSLAGRLTRAGMDVALVERHLFGGTCVNTGCMPTKTLVASASAAHLARRAGDYGVVIGASIAIDMAKVKARADTVSGNARASVEAWLRGMERLTVLTGHARFEGPNSVRVGDALLTAERIFINVGGRARVPDMPGVDTVPYLTNTSMLALAMVPRHLVVVGGSYIGLEFAQMYRRFGAEVTVVEMGPRLVGREDEDVSAAVRAVLEREEISIRTNAECIRFAPHVDGVAVGVDCTSGEPEVVGSHVLLAVGRRPNTDDLGLELAGVDRDPHGYIKVDDQLATNVPGIWALGDCNGRGAFTHTAYNDYEILAANLLDGDSRRVTDRIPAYALYIDPPLARVGLSETEARASGRRILVGKRPMSRVGRAVEKDETQGFMKIVVDAENQRILGATILGVGGDEAIHSVIDMMAMRATATDLRRTMHIHPTVAELLPTIAGELKPSESGEPGASSGG
ncbi:FAD-containing oxidoreductase [Singulisphaera sp. Ch08]|uniref:FAD-containing oxidoreductase n=1 Tax=Singulisphaera sp. Ch08 TaxID=3120278 RepID=A0AAU7CRL5_9BACT